MDVEEQVKSTVRYLIAICGSFKLGSPSGTGLKQIAFQV